MGRTLEDEDALDTEDTDDAAIAAIASTPGRRSRHHHHCRSRPGRAGLGLANLAWLLDLPDLPTERAPLHSAGVALGSLWWPGRPLSVSVSGVFLKEKTAAKGRKAVLVDGV